MGKEYDDFNKKDYSFVNETKIHKIVNVKMTNIYLNFQFKTFKLSAYD